MKLGAVRDGVCYCTDGHVVGTWCPDEGFEPRGTVPNPATGIDRLRYAAVTSSLAERVLCPVTGGYTPTNIWPVGATNVLVSVGPWIFVSPDGGRNWRFVRELESSGVMGLLPTSVCEHDGDVYLAEYTQGDRETRILVSSDLGRTWSTFHATSDVRHFHGVFSDPYTGRLWGTTGDGDDECAVGYFVDGEFRPVGRGSQRWRAVDLAFTPNAILWGMDCYYADRVSLFRLSREGVADEPDSEPRPDPDVVGTTDQSVYFLETTVVGGETWAVAATAAEVGGDSAVSVPGAQSPTSPTARVLAAPASSGFEDWRELCSFTRRSTIGERFERLPSSNAYVFIATDPELGLLVNPYNTETDHGDIFTVSPGAFRTTAERGTSPRPQGER